MNNLKKKVQISYVTKQAFAQALREIVFDEHMDKTLKDKESGER